MDCPEIPIPPHSKALQRNLCYARALIRHWPRWADNAAIQNTYNQAAALRKAGHAVTVDHIIPLHGTTVSGLHVHNNLRIISRAANEQKGAFTWPGKFDEQLCLDIDNGI